MPIDVIMPQMGESIFEGTLTKWLKKAGDRVEKDEPLFEISTDKVDAEIPSPVAGVLSEIKVPEGETVEVNTVVAVVTEHGEAAAGPGKKGQAAQAGEARAAVSTPAASGTPAPKAAAAAKDGERIRSSPLVRKIAAEHNIDLSLVAGTGLDGRITKEDVLRRLSEHGASSAAASAAKRPDAVATSATSAASALAGQVTPLSRMRAIIAERMVESVQISPHVHSVYKVDMTRVVRIREREKASFEQSNGVKLTYMPFIAAAVVEALRKFPIVNASLESTAQGLAIRYHRSIDLGIAVALDWGLIVPVIRHAEQRSFADLARSIADLALRARSKKLLPDEVGGSTFTLTNAGAFGGEYGMPIINQPEAAILAVGGLRKEPAVLTDAEGNDSIAIRSTQYFCLGFDHRLIDGADGGKFMLEFKKTLESWSQEIG